MKPRDLCLRLKRTSCQSLFKSAKKVKTPSLVAGFDKISDHLKLLERNSSAYSHLIRLIFFYPTLTLPFSSFSLFLLVSLPCPLFQYLCTMPSSPYLNFTPYIESLVPYV